MKKLFLLTATGLLLPWMAFAQSWGYSTPRLGGGYNYYKYRSNGGSSWGYSTPRLGGGYNYYNYGNNGGSSWGYSTPRLGGGYNYYHYGW